MLVFYLFSPYVYIKYLCYNFFLLTQTLFSLDMEDTLFSFFFQRPFTYLKKTCDDPPHYHSLFSYILFFLLSACHWLFYSALVFAWKYTDHCMLLSSVMVKSIIYIPLLAYNFFKDQPIHSLSHIW